MRLPVLPILAACGLLISSPATSAQQPNPDGTVSINTYWLRSSGAKEYDNIKPFRRPLGVTDNIPGQARDLIADLTEMQRLAINANQLQLMIDPDGREICSIRAWTQAHENVKANGLNMEGWLGKILREDNDVRTRRACIYGMFYFNDPQKIIQLISNLPGEPLRDLREAGFEFALRYMRVHYKKSSPQNPKFPDNGIVVPKYEFNPLPFFLLLDQKQTIDQRQGLWFLTEVLKIRRDLGRVYFEELEDRLSKMLMSQDKDLRQQTIRFLAAIDQNQKRVPKAEAEDATLKAWYDDISYELFPPIRHLSTGRCDLYPSEDLDNIIAAGKRVLIPALFPPATARLKAGATRYGIRLGRVTEPLSKLGMPFNSVIVSINNQAVLSAEHAKKVFVNYFAELKASEKSARERAEATGQPAPPQKIPTIQVEYIFRQRAYMKEYRLLQ